jgi:hypothetical protein
MPALPPLHPLAVLHQRHDFAEHHDLFIAAEATQAQLTALAGSITLPPPAGPSHILTIDAALGSTFTVTLAASATLAAPLNPQDGRTFSLRFYYTASHVTLTYDPVFDFGAAGPPHLSQKAGLLDILSFTYVAPAPPLRPPRPPCWCLLFASLGN